MVQRAKYKRDRKPLIFIVCEGRNKTERTYFGHFNTRKAPFNLHIENSEATDIASMAKKKYKNIEIIPSNPCFEIWLLYYFTEAPKVVHSSQRVKEEMAKKLPGYTESMDVVDVANLYDKHWIAIKNSETKNSRYAEELNILSKNPYTEVATVVKELLRRLNES